MLISETHINATEHHMIGESEPYEPFFADENPRSRKVFDLLVKEYGRCVSKVYIDPNAQHVGYVFVKTDHYEDTGEPYLHETWITFHDAPTETKRISHYATL